MSKQQCRTKGERLDFLSLTSVGLSTPVSDGMSVDFVRLCSRISEDVGRSAQDCGTSRLLGQMYGNRISLLSQVDETLGCELSDVLRKNAQIKRTNAQK